MGRGQTDQAQVKVHSGHPLTKNDESNIVRCSVILLFRQPCSCRDGPGPKGSALRHVCELPEKAGVEAGSPTPRPLPDEGSIAVALRHRFGRVECGGTPVQPRGWHEGAVLRQVRVHHLLELTCTWVHECAVRGVLCESALPSCVRWSVQCTCNFDVETAARRGGRRGWKHGGNGGGAGARGMAWHGA